MSNKSTNLYSQQLPKHHIVFEVSGNIDEVISQLGLCKPILFNLIERLDLALVAEIGLALTKDQITIELTNLIKLKQEVLAYPDHHKKHLSNPDYDKLKQQDVEDLCSVVETLQAYLKKYAARGKVGEEGVTSAYLNNAKNVCSRATRSFSLMGTNYEVREVCMEYFEALGGFVELAAKITEEPRMVGVTKGFYGSAQGGFSDLGSFGVN